MRFLEYAIMFAIEAHKGQKRKFDGSPYIRHPMSVMGMMTELTDDPKVLSAAVLHDTVEDCEDVTLEVIHERFGEEVAGYVFYATEKSVRNGMSRKERKNIDLIHYSNGGYVSQNIKVLDMIDNIPSMFNVDTDHALQYIVEKSALLSSLERADQIIKDRAWNVMDKMWGRL